MTSNASVPQAARPVQRLLERLQGVRQRGTGRWSAKCPAHADRFPSLSVAEGRDGRALITCWAGCRPEEIVGAVGLTMGDLFADERPRRSETPEERRARQKAAADAALARWLNQECEAVYRRLATVYRAATNFLAQRGLAVPDWALPTIHALPWLEDVMDRLAAEKPEERLAALGEAKRWLGA